MIGYPAARKRAGFLRDAVDAAARVLGPDAPRIAAEVWAGVTAAPSPAALAEAVSDVCPVEFAALAATDELAAAFATAAIVGALAELPRVPDDPSGLRAAARTGWATFEQLARAGGYQEHGQGADLSAAWPVLQQIAERNIDPEAMRRIALLAGRMLAALRGARAERVEHVPEQVVGTELGGDFGSLVPTEYALLGHPVTRAHLLGRVARRQAVQLRRVGRDRKSRGPLVIAVDESGSMMGEQNEWSKAALTALARSAWEARRPVVVVHFSTATRIRRLDPQDWKALAEAQASFLSGGTDIADALDAGAEQVVELARAGQSGADVVLLSDGGDAGGRIGEALDRLDKVGARLWSIAIDSPFCGPLRDRAARYVYLQAGQLTADPLAEFAGATEA